MSQPYNTFGPQPSAAAAPFPSPPQPISADALLPAKRYRLNVVAVFVNVALPWAAFCAIFAALSFKLHWLSPNLAWASVALGLKCALSAGVLGYRARQQRADPTWYTFCAIALLVASGLAAVAGAKNFGYNLEPYYMVQDMNAYPAVNPAREKGQQLMDAGRVYFAEGTALDMEMATVFRNVDLYCAVPIVNGKEEPDSYDFWAVGMNCCSADSVDFRCGEFDNPHARAGLRLMRDEERPFYRLAVQQAEAAYNIKATHPLFFTWIQDPVAEIEEFRRDGFKYFLIGIFSHFVFNLVCVGLAAFTFGKVGYY